VAVGLKRKPVLGSAKADEGKTIERVVTKVRPWRGGGRGHGYSRGRRGLGT